ncbi:alpha-hydroxy acid oxidase [Sporichthya sp.]|uniref:alpha-hydroxy acid oxidase n=1 Tax=Sporichthya sp. TaxID=65475 RepID=UPI0017F6EB85|nr:alpha-hydroxy acid oxidase [Sporichthya sp.]MBA3741962.1 alpha-hydroxy-acid oxidizing protein [Sporichthya sp.]
MAVRNSLLSELTIPSLRAPLVNVESYRQVARRRLPRSIFDFVDGGAGDEVTTRANETAFAEATFRPRPMVDVAQRDLSTTVLGRRVEMPVLLGPAGSTRLVHPEGELAVARAAARLGTVYALSAASNFPLEEVADAGRGATLWFQVYHWKDAGIVADLVARAKNAGFHALCVTIDVPLSGVKDRDLRNGLTIPPRLTVRNAFDTCRRVRWLRGFVTGDPITFKNLEPYSFEMAAGVMGLSTFMREKLNNPSSTWEDLRWLRDLWDGPLVVKGVLTADAARRCFDAGADGVVCSNHGGRQLNGNPASFVALPEVLEAAHNRNKEVFLDGGVRRGTDVVKALAAGATACLVARPYHWGLVADGEDGVVAVGEHLRSEIDNVLAQLGVPRAVDLDRTSIRWERMSERAAGHLPERVPDCLPEDPRVDAR